MVGTAVLFVYTSRGNASFCCSACFLGFPPKGDGPRSAKSGWARAPARAPAGPWAHGNSRGISHILPLQAPWINKFQPNTFVTPLYGNMLLGSAQ